MSEAVVDASVVLKWYLRDETDADAALALQAQHVTGALHLVVPELLYLEVANALRWKRGVSRELADEALAGLWALGLEIAPLTEPLLREALRLAHALGATVHDALYLALARARDCELVTADARFLALVRKADMQSARGLTD